MKSHAYFTCFLLTQTWRSFGDNDLSFAGRIQFSTGIMRVIRVCLQPAMARPRPEEPGDLGASDSMRSQLEHSGLEKVDCWGALYGEEQRREHCSDC